MLNGEEVDADRNLTEACWEKDRDRHQAKYEKLNDDHIDLALLRPNGVSGWTV